MAVHNHGPEEGAGLSCNEFRLPSGDLRGACIITTEELRILELLWSKIQRDITREVDQ